MTDVSFKQEQSHPFIEGAKYLHSRQPVWSANSSGFLYCALPSFEQHLDLLMHLTRNSKVLLMMTGEEGVGKTTLLQQAAQQARDFAQVHMICGAQDFDLTRLMSGLRQGFNVAALHSHQDPMEGLIEQLEQLQQRPNPSVLFIDEADKLPLETIAALLTLTEYSIDRTISLRIVLVGRQQLIKHLQYLGTQYPIHEIIHALQLESLSFSETESYLQFYFEQLHSCGVFPLNDQQLHTIFEQSHGVLSQIKLLAEDAVEGNVMQYVGARKSSWWAALIQAHGQKIVGALAIAVVLGILIFFQSNFYGSPKKNAQVMPNDDHNLAIVADKTTRGFLPATSEGGLVLRDPKFAEGTLLEETQLNQDGLSSSQGIVQTPVAALNTKSNVLDPSLTKDERRAEFGQTNQMQPPGERRNVPTIGFKGDVVVKNEVIPIIPTVTATRKRDDTRDRASVRNVDEGRESRVSITEGFKEKPLRSTRRESARDSSKSLEIPGKLGAARAASGQHVLARDGSAGAVLNGNGYSLQLVSVSTEDRARAFIKAHNFGEKAHYKKVTSGDRSVFVVTYGTYSSHEAASNAIKALVKDNPDVHPWIKENA